MMTIRTGLLLILLLGLVPPTPAAEGSNAKKIAKSLKVIGKMIKHKEYENAMFIIEGLLKDNATHSGVLYEKAHLLELQKKIPAAIKAYEKCLEVLLETDSSSERKRLIDKIKKALLRIDKSRRIVMKHADELEREAKKFKGKDEYTYGKIMDVVSYMRGAWDEEEEADEGGGSNKRKKHQLAKLHRGFIEALLAEDTTKALKYIDPRTIQIVGKEKAKGFLLQLIGMTKQFAIKKKNIGKTTVTLGESGRDARVEGSFRVNGKVHQADPEYWILKNKKWYLGDDEKLKRFNAAKDE